MNSKTRQIIIFLIVFVFIITTILVILINLLKKDENNDEFSNTDTGDTIGSSLIDEYGKTINDSIDKIAYFDINKCVSQYLDIINIENSNYYGQDDYGNYVKIDEDEIKSDIYDVLSDSYIQKNNITVKNVYNYVNVEKEKLLFVPLEVKVVGEGKINSFLVHGITESILDYTARNDIFLIVNIDATNNLFSIEPINGKYESIKEINISSKVNTIKKTINNEFYRESVSAQTTIKDYINIFKRLSLGRPDIMFEKLDKEYREKRFGNLESFKRYIEDNRQEIIGIRAEQYLFNEYSDYTEYVAKDQYENLYIFNEKSVLNYDVKLDTYTLENEKFTETYKTASEEKRVQMNIDKFVQMINRHDYITAYNCISQGFKNNYFRTQAEFENYIKNVMFDYNKLTFSSYEKKGSNLYVYKIQLTDLTKKSLEVKYINIIMQLNDNLDFEMSFGV